jgi:serine phosphatase RsbU (regulator of sigma subunit)
MIRLHLFRSCDRYIKDAAIEDDITLVVIKIEEKLGKSDEEK